MGKVSTATKNKWNAKAYDQLRVLVKKGQKDIIAAYAAAQGQSLNGYINKLIADDMGAALTVPKPEDPDI
ncbi:MAG: antitoxin [Ruminococcus sp.]|nr:antitoxin [Ruminococcus sp.]